METVSYHGMRFRPFISREQIAEQVARLAGEIRRDYPDGNPVFLCVLNGAFMFAADLLRACALPQSEVTFIRFKSYEGTSSTGTVQQVMGLAEDIAGRDVIVVEDIVDTGLTASQLRRALQAHNPRSVSMATLFFKPHSLRVGTPPEYVGFEIPPLFIIGYGLDINGQARDLDSIYILDEPQ